MHRTHIAAKAVLLGVFFLALAAGLAACATGTATVAPSPTLTAAPSPAPTAVPSPSPTKTSEPTQTPMVTPSPTPLPTETPIALPTKPLPTAASQPSGDGVQRTARVPILMYHHIADLPANAGNSDHEYKVPPTVFEEQLRYLSENGYQSVRLYELTAYLKGGAPLPEKPVILTFDDGYRDNAVTALALLLKYGFTATFFVNSQPINDEYPAYMTWAQVEQLSLAGMDVESHSHTHPNLKGKTVDEVLREVNVSKEMIEEHTGRQVHFFSYPYGGYDQQVKDILAVQDYWGAVTLRAGIAQKSQAMFDLARVWVHADDTLESFAVKLERGW